MKNKKQSTKNSELMETKEGRLVVFEKLLNHLLAGFSIDCFPPMSAEMIGRYLEIHPLEFCRERLEETMREAKAGWESIGRRQAEGSCLGNSRSWYYNMSNRYGWSDRQQIDQKNSGQVQVEVISYARKAPESGVSASST